MIKAIDLDGFRGAESRVRCFPHILNLSVKVSRHFLDIILSCYSRNVKAILSQFANQLDDDAAPSIPAPKSRKVRVPAKRRAHTLTMDASRGARKIVSSDTSDDDGHSSDGDDEECRDATTSVRDSSPFDTLDQDEDIIRAAEEAQAEDLNEAAQSAELQVIVTDGEQKVASTALSKVSIVIDLRALSEHLMITLDSSRDSRTRSTTLPAFSKR
jgi:hypothetical protein